MTLDLDSLEKLADEATPGPWVYEGTGYTDDGGQYREVTSPAEVIFGEWSTPSEENAAFIAAANPQAIKALIAELKEARAVIDRLASSEAFDVPQAISGPLAAEMRARMDAARAFLARNGKGEG